MVIELEELSPEGRNGRLCCHRHCYEDYSYELRKPWLVLETFDLVPV